MTLFTLSINYSLDLISDTPVQLPGYLVAKFRDVGVIHRFRILCIEILVESFHQFDFCLLHRSVNKASREPGAARNRSLDRLDLQLRLPAVPIEEIRHVAVG